jgi:HEAT repeat protein
MNTLKADGIIELLEEPTEHRYPVKLRITQEAEGNEIIKALERASEPLTRQILCDILGDRFERSAVLILLECLQDSSIGIRGSAADALGLIGDHAAGPSLAVQYEAEEQGSVVRHLLSSALGAVAYRPAIPLLLEALQDKDSVLRGSAAWSLGMMPAPETREAIESALQVETEPPESYVMRRLPETLEAFQLVHTALESPSPQYAVALLITAIDRDRHSHVGLRLSCAAWTLGRLHATEGLEPLQRFLAQFPAGFLSEHLKAAIRAIQGNLN